MGLESLSTVFNDLSQNQIQQTQQVAGQTTPPPVNPQYEELVNFTPLGDIMGNQDVLIIPPPITNSEFDNIVPIQPITQGQFPSPLSDSTSNYQEVSETNLNIRRNVLQPSLGTNNRLGVGDFTLESLYNVNHTAVTNREPINIGQFDYDGNPLLINTVRAGMGDLTQLDIKAHGDPFRFSAFGGADPYIINNIGSDFLRFSNRDTSPASAFVEDTDRVLSFYTSAKGIATIQKENIQAKIGIGETIGVSFLSNPAGYARELAKKLIELNVIPATPNNIYGQIGFGFGVNSRFPTRIEYSKKFFSPLDRPVKDFNDEKPERSVLGEKIGGTIDKVAEKLDKGFRKLRVALTSEQAVLDAELKQAEAAAQAKVAAQDLLNSKQTNRPSKFFDFSGLGNHSDEGIFPGAPPKKAKLHGYKDEITEAGGVLGAVPSPGALGQDRFNQLQERIAPKGRGDFFVRIRDLRSGDYIFFRGFVTGITENVSPSFTPTNYIGRSEPVYTYERAERDISFNLRVYPYNSTEQEAIYGKLNRLTSLAYPEYLPEADNSLVRMKAPFTELFMAHIGTRAQGQFGFIKSLSYTVNENGDWDMKSMLPRLFDIAISYQILNRKPPLAPGQSPVFYNK